jgi:hypothetical protein
MNESPGNSGTPWFRPPHSPPVAPASVQVRVANVLKSVPDIRQVCEWSRTLDQGEISLKHQLNQELQLWAKQFS